MKTYLRYQQGKSFGIVASPDCNAIFVPSGGSNSSVAVVGALECIQLWNVRSGTLLATLSPPLSSNSTKYPAIVTCIAMHPRNTNYIAAGYSDGTIRTWDISKSELNATYHGHKAAITSIVFSKEGNLLLAGGKDTEITLWDITAQSGVCRLKGHKDWVTCLKFFSGDAFCISSSKDGLLKVWDVQAQVCVQTFVGHRAEVWSFAMNAAQTRVLSAGSEDEVKIWDFSLESLEYNLVGEIQLQNKSASKRNSRISKIQFNSTETIVYLQSSEKFIERMRVRSADEIKKKIARKKKRGTLKEDDNVLLDYELLTAIRSESKFRSMDILQLSSPSDRILVTNMDNAVSIIEASINDTYEYSELCKTELPGHRSAIRGVVVSSDDSLVLTTSQNETKLWNLNSSHCIRTFTGGYGITVQFLPGNQYFVIGTKSGHLELFHIPTGDLVQKLPAHSGPVYAINIQPNNRGLISAGADHEVKFHEFDICPETNRLNLAHIRTLRLQDEILAICYSKNGKYLAVGALDSQIRVFYADSLKLHLILYGHKLPVLALDISDDGDLLVSGSADKSIKVWGLDFGDCHKSFAAAHEDSITSIGFVPGTHHFFSAGKDSGLKYWDADKHIRIQELPGDCAEIWSIAVGSTGNFLVSGGSSRAIKVWRETNDQVFIDEEADRALEQVYEEEAVKDMDSIVGDKGIAKGSVDSLKASERLIDYIEIYRKESERDDNSRSSAPNPLLMGKTLEEFLLFALGTVPSPDLQITMQLLPYESAIILLVALDDLIEKGLGIELVVRCQMYLLEVHFGVLSSGNARGLDSSEVLEKARDHTRKRLRDMRDRIGFNLAGLRFLKEELATSVSMSEKKSPDTVKKAKIVV